MNQIAPAHRECLLKLARLANFLDDLPSDKFYIPTWCSHDYTATSCGTAGCIAGWAATVYSKEGWGFDKAGFSDGPTFARDGMVMSIPRLNLVPTPYVVIPEAGGSVVRWGTEAFAIFFGISKKEAAALCVPSFWTDADYAAYPRFGEITPREAAAKTRKLIATYDPSILIEAEGSKPKEVPCGKPASTKAPPAANAGTACTATSAPELPRQRLRVIEVPGSTPTGSSWPSSGMDMWAWTWPSGLPAENTLLESPFSP